MKHYLFIDESGGASPDKGVQDFLTIGGVLVSEDGLNDIDNAQKKILNNINRVRKRDLSHLHASHLSHEHRVFISKWINTLPVVGFGVVSNRKTYEEKHISNMDNQHEYGHKLNSASQNYHRNIRLLLEMVGAFVRDKKIDSNLLEIIVEKSSHPVDKLRKYILQCQKNPKNPKVKRVFHVRASNIKAEPKGSLPGLVFADFVSNALYRSVCREPKNLNMTETRYFLEMKSKFQSKERNVLDEIKPAKDGHINFYMRSKMESLTEEDHVFINSLNMVTT